MISGVSILILNPALVACNWTYNVNIGLRGQNIFFIDIFFFIRFYIRFYINLFKDENKMFYWWLT